MECYPNIDELCSFNPDFDKYMSRCGADVWDYVEYALSQGCWIEKDINGYRLFSQGTDRAGGEVRFYVPVDHARPNNDWLWMQSVAQDFRDISRGTECLGVDIWDVPGLVEAASRCDVCGNHCAISELKSHHYAGGCCSECYPAQVEDWNNKPNGYWTH